MDVPIDPALLGEGGITAGLLWIIYKVGTRMIAAVDRLSERVGGVEDTVIEIAGAVGADVKIPRHKKTIPPKMEST